LESIRVEVVGRIESEQRVSRPLLEVDAGLSTWAVPLLNGDELC
jgi:hypothetical protein